VGRTVNWVTGPAGDGAGRLRVRPANVRMISENWILFSNQHKT
jgi:hypothetical protein